MNTGREKGLSHKETDPFFIKERKFYEITLAKKSEELLNLDAKNDRLL